MKQYINQPNGLAREFDPFDKLGFTIEFALAADSMIVRRLLYNGRQGATHMLESSFAVSENIGLKAIITYENGMC